MQVNLLRLMEIQLKTGDLYRNYFEFRKENSTPEMIMTLRLIIYIFSIINRKMDKERSRHTCSLSGSKKSVLQSQLGETV